jgi:hypothetical protein
LQRLCCGQVFRHGFVDRVLELRRGQVHVYGCKCVHGLCCGQVRQGRRVIWNARPAEKASSRAPMGATAARRAPSTRPQQPPRRLTSRPARASRSTSRARTAAPTSPGARVSRRAPPERTISFSHFEVGSFKADVGPQACTPCASPRNASRAGSTSADACSCRAGEIARRRSGPRRCWR